MPRGVRASTESTDFVEHVGEEILDFMSVKNGMPEIEPVTDREFKDLAEYELFMQDPLVIRIHTTTDANASPAVPVWINGEGGWLPRGRMVRVQRKFVERLAQSQTASFRTERDPNPHAEVGMNVRRTNGQDYPFEVLQDPNPKGRSWLARVTRQSC